MMFDEDFSRKRIAANRNIKEKDFWLRKMSGDWQRSYFPYDNIDHKVDGSNRESFKFPIPGGLNKRLTEISQGAEPTLHILLTAVWVTLLARYTGKRDIIVGVPVYKSGKEGELINTALPLRNHLVDDMAFKEILYRVRETLLEAIDHQNFPIEILPEQLNIPYNRESGDDFPLFDVAILLENIHNKRYLKNLPLNIAICFSKRDGALEGELEYNPARYAGPTVQRIVGHFLGLLQEVLFNVDMPLWQMEYLPEAEKQQLLYTFNDTSAQFPVGKTVHGLFEEQVERTPNRIAVSTPLNLGDIYDALESSVSFTSSLRRKLGNCCFQKNKHIYQSRPFWAGFTLLKNYRHNSMVVDTNTLQLLEFLDGGRNIESIFSQLRGRDIEFFIYSVPMGDLLEITFDFDIKPERFSVFRFEDFFKLIRRLYRDGFIELAAVKPGKSLPGDVFSREFKSSDKQEAHTPVSLNELLRRQEKLSSAGAEVLLLGDTPGMPSTGLLYLAAYLRRNSVTACCQFYDAALDYETMKKTIETLLDKIQPRIVAISMKWFLYIARVFDICKIIKDYAAQRSLPVKVVVGGNTASYYWQEIIDNPAVDYLIRGDGEEPLLQLCKAEDPSTVPNIVYKSAGKTVENPVAYVQDGTNSSQIYLSHLDEIILSPYPSLFGTFFLYTHKGCAMNCLYCGGCNKAQQRTFSRKGVFQRAVEEVRQDILAALEYTSTFQFDFDTPNKNLVEYCRKIWEDIDLSGHFCIYSNLTLPSPALIELAQKTFKYVYCDIDITTLAERHRKQLVSMGLVKPMPTDEEILAFLDRCEGYENIEVRINLITGLPYFTEEDIAPGEALLAEIMANYSCFSELHWARLHAQPGAPVVEDAGKHHMHSYASTYDDFLEYSRKNFSPESGHQRLEDLNYPYIYYKDDRLNSKVTQFYTKNNAKIERHKAGKRRQLIVSEELTYLELNQKADDLAAFLREKGVTRGSIVGLMLERSPGIIHGILGILKAGAAYLPIDPEYPQKRRTYMLEDSGAAVLVTAGMLAEETGKLTGAPLSQSRDIVYVIYTSGTTGKSKGVGITHENLVNYAHWFAGEIRLTERDKSILATSFAFDLGYTTIYPALLRGAGCHILPRELYLSADELIRYIKEKEITYIKMTPSLFSTMVNSPKFSARNCGKLRFAALGGEAIIPGDLEKAHGLCSHLQIMNHYGPTEATIGCIGQMIDFQRFPEYKRNPVIGTPIANSKAYILDKYMRLLPVGVPGELCISGTCLAAGYLNRPELTAEKFCLRPRGAGSLLKIYRTGDMACRMADGTIAFLGRIDHQVKIRGYRVELGEIENRLSKHLQIEESVVLVKENEDGEKYINAYYVPKELKEQETVDEGIEIGGEVVDVFDERVKKTPGAIAIKSAAAGLSYKTLNKRALELAHLVEAKYDDRYMLSDSEKLRYKRQMLLHGWGIESQEKLKSTTVFVAGAGGGGSPTIVQLALLGFGTIKICDFDDIELSNLNRQFLHDEERLGMNKALSAKITVNRTNPNVKVVPYTEKLTRENVFELVGDSDIIFDMFDGPADKFILSECAVVKQIPHVIISMTDLNAYTAVLHSPHTPCYHCIFDRKKLETIVSGMKDYVEKYSKNPLAVASTSLFVSTGTAINESLKVLLGLGKPSYNKFFYFNHRGGEDGLRYTASYRSMTHLFSEHFRRACKEQGFDWEEGWRDNLLEVLDIEPDPGCPVCGVKGKEKRAALEVQMGKAAEASSNGDVEQKRVAAVKPTAALLSDDDTRIAAGILGILKAGKRCVPLDPSAEAEELVRILGNCGARVIVTDSRCLELAKKIRDRVNRHIEIIDTDTIETDESQCEHGAQTMGDPGAAALYLYHGSGTAAKAIVDAFSKGEAWVDEATESVSPGKSVYGLDRLPEYLRQELPVYMMPTHFIRVAEMPLTPNAKIDRRALAALPETGAALPAVRTAPRNELEEKLADIWAEVLDIDKEKIGIASRFFELGGHSLNAAILTAKLHKELNVNVQLSDIFRMPTLEELAGFLGEASTGSYTPVTPVKEGGHYPLSSAQKRLYVLQQLEPGNISYNNPMVMEVKGDIERVKLEETLVKLQERHESLRTSFELVEEQPMQRIHPAAAAAVAIEYYDVLKLKDEAERITRDFVKPFDLAQVPLLRLGLIKRGEANYLLMVDQHHIITDGVSLGIFIKDFMALYRGETLPPLKIQYKDYTAWQNREKSGPRMVKQEEHWVKQFQGEIPQLVLPYDYSRPLVRSLEGRTLHFHLGDRQTAALNRLAKTKEVTLFMVLLAAFNVLLSRLSGQDDIVVGTAVSGRQLADFQQVIGMFVNTLALRNYPIGNKGFNDFLEEIKERTLQAFENQEYQFEDLVEKIGVSRDTDRHPLFDVIFALQNMEIPTVEIPGLTLRQHPYESGISRVDITVLGVELDGKLQFSIEYGSKLFKGETMERFSSCLRRVLEQVCEEPDEELRRLEILPLEEKIRILGNFNDTFSDYPREKTIHGLFEEQAARTPDAEAVVFHGDSLTYGELDRRAAMIALALQERGSGREIVVGIMIEPSLEMIVGVLGILKAGGGYLPIAADYPEARKKYMLTDSSDSILLTDNADGTGDYSQQVLNLKDAALYRGKGDIKIEGGAGWHNLAYIIYTSGSTGHPKGVMVEHRNVVRLVRNTNFVSFGRGDRILQTGALEFDASTFEVWGALLNGLGLYLSDKTGILSSDALKASIRRYDIATMWLTSPLFNQMVLADVEIFAGLKNLLVGGDVLVPENIARITAMHPGLNVINGYGPTENTTFSTTFSITRRYEDSIPIGAPIANSTAYILDKNFNLQPIGVVGELCVGGDGVARGYLNNPELTAERFQTYISDKIYRTGDRARWMADGNIEYLGRVDHQVKIRGYRVETGEIESLILQYPEVREAVVMVFDGVVRGGVSGQGKFLCAYIVAAANLEVSRLKEYLSLQLPSYMVPSYFIRLDRIPLNANGKIDRKALPVPDDSFLTVSTDHIAPKDDVQQTIAGVWQEVLKIEHVGIDENFFDLGGNSLLIVQLNNRLKKLFKRDFPVVSLFQYPTVEEFASFLTAGEAGVGKKQEMEAVREPVVESGAGKSGYDIAVIGMAGRFPGAANIDEFWNNLKNGVESLTYFTTGEMEASGVDPLLVKNPDYVGVKGILEGIEYFDSDFFAYTPREAGLMDPQMRIFHECAWQALEDGGYWPDRYPGSIGLYAGASSNSYWEGLTLLSGKSAEIGQWSAFQLTDKDFLNTRVSYKLNLKGPAFGVQSACSTSLVAIHLACRALLNGECHMALAGGVSITLPVQQGHLYQEGMVMSPDGHCRAFDRNAQGMVGGSGVGIVLLKPLAAALAEGDHIYAVIKGTAINNDGVRKVGYTAPSIEGQAEVIKAALRAAKVNPETVTYVEAHGTGTALGDPVESEALKLAFAANKKSFCRIGSVKTNMGHLDVAAGVTGFIKTVLSLQHRQIPPSLHFEAPNPKIDFENSPFMVNGRLYEWERGEYPLRAGVSSFGIGGTNAHVVLEEAPEVKGQETEDREYQLILLSARSEFALDKMTKNLADHLKKYPNINFADAAYTLQVGRKSFQYRGRLVCSGAGEAVEILTGESRKMRTFACKKENPAVVFMFPGLGSQYEDMGLELYQKEPLFRAEMDKCFEILKPLLDIDIKNLLYPDKTKVLRGVQGGGFSKEPPWPPEAIQVIVFIFGYALARLLISWGIKPRAMIGYSFGEYVAAHLAGVFSLEDALKLIVLRGRLVRKTVEGAMLSVPLTVEKIKPFIAGGDLDIAIDNGPSCIVSGPVGAVEVFEERMKKEKLLCMRVQTSRAFHSAVMEPVLKEFAEKVGEIPLKPPAIPYISNVTGTWIRPEEAVNPSYWATHLRQTVRFAEGIEILLKRDITVMVEVGPGRDLSNLMGRHLETRPGLQVVNPVRNPGQQVPDLRYLLNSVGNLWLYGVPVDWSGFHGEEKQTRRRISLPAYPFEPLEYPVEGDLAALGETFNKNAFLRKKPDLADWFYAPTWERSPLEAAEAGETRESSPWLVFMDDRGLGEAVVKRLQKEKQEVFIVRVGEAFTRLEKRECRINPEKIEDYYTLFIQLRKGGKIPGNILHLWNVTANDPGESQLVEIDRTQGLGFFSLLNIAQAVGKEGITDDIQMVVVSNGIHEVIGGEKLSPGKATLLGAVKIIPLEYLNISCKSIDIIFPGPGSPGENLPTDRLLAEFKSLSDDNVIAFRGLHRWVQGIKPHRLGKPAEPVQRLKEKGVYLVTGGFGGMGYTLAGYLARAFKARLVLVGRSPLPAREEWGTWLSSHEENHPVSTRIRQVLALEEQGAEVMVFSADVSDYNMMETVIEEVKQHFGPINGVLHTAGVVDFGGVIQKRTRDISEPVLAPKVKGTLVLDALLKDPEPDFIVLFSSMGNIVYRIKVGEVAYCAANEFLDAFAYYNASRAGMFTAAINWTDWLEVGMAAETALRRFGEASGDGGYEHLIFGAVTNAEGIDIFTRVLENKVRHVGVSPLDLPAVLERLAQPEEAAGAGKGAADETPVRLSSHRPDLSSEYAPPENDIQRKLADIWQRFFGIQKIGIRDDFFELGGDSLKAMTVVANIHKELKIKVSLAQLFDSSTIEGLSASIGGAVEEHYAPVEPVESKHYYALSSAQKRLYILQQMETDSTGYNEGTAVVLEGTINGEKLEGTFRELIERHESLRTSFEMVDEEPVQRIHKKVEFRIEYRENHEGHEGHEDSFVRPFDLSRAPLVRVGLVKMNETQHLLMLDLHHIIADGLSAGIFVTEFVALYAGKDLPALKLQYKDFVQWQDKEKEKEEIKRQADYWLKEFAGEVPVLDLPYDFKRPAVQSFEGRRIDFEIGPQVTGALKNLAAEKESTLFITLLAVFNVLMSKLGGQEDIVVGTSIAGRRHADLQQIIGLFINTLALRNYPAAGTSFNGFLKEVTKRTLAAFENQDFQFEDLVEEASVTRDSGRNPLFDVMLELQTRDIPAMEQAGLKVKPYEYETNISKFDLILNGMEQEGRLFLQLEYCAKLFKEETIQRFIVYFRNILAAVLEDDEREISAIEIITEKEKEQVLFGFNDTKREFPREECYHRLFAQQVSQRPGGIAAVYNGEQITYKELDEGANRLARYLLESGAAPGDFIGLYMKRSIRMLVSIIGVFKAGCAYLPLEKEYPEERVKYILENSEARLVISDAQPGEAALMKYPAAPPACRSTVDDLAYMIYTSGTTGQPKGVMIHQQGMINHLFAKINQLGISCEDIVAQTASACFDISVWQFLAAPLTGGRVVVIHKETVLDAEKFLLLLQTSGVTILESVPSLMTAFLEMTASNENASLDNLRWMIPTGEALGVPLVRKWYRHYPGIKLVNAYGPTEASDDITHYVVEEIPREDQHTIPIGKPLQNLHIYIMDKNLSLCPVGVRGEICVAGTGVGKGYWKDPEKTGKAFVPNPYYPEIGDSDYAMIYRTGDIGYYMEDGNIEFLGRLDFQVKIRGNRIELEEIENRLLKQDHIKEAVVIDRQDEKGEKFLCAYLVTVPGVGEDISQLRVELANDLPDYMIPAYFVKLDEIPLTANGKVDRKALPPPEAVGIEQEYIAPRDDVQKKLAAIWAEVLGTADRPLSIDANFFELGGHSLKATIVISNIHKEFRVKVPLVEVFRAPTIRGLSGYIKEAARVDYTSIEPAPQKAYYQLSSAQKRLFILQQMDPGGTVYNLPEVYYLEGHVEREKLDRVFHRLIARHESLRTSFEIKEGKPAQKIHPDAAFEVGYYEPAESEEEQIVEDFVKPFNLSQAPLLRAGLVKINEQKHIFMVDMHHIIADGISSDILVGEFLQLFAGMDLPELRIQYKDYSEWQNSGTTGEVVGRQGVYWLEEFSGEIPVLDLPVDYPRPALQSFEGDRVNFAIGKDETKALKELALKEDVTLFMLLLSLYYIFLAKLSGQEDIVIGTPAAARGHADLERIIGMFVNTLAVRNYPLGTKTFSRFLQETKAKMLGAYENQEYQFEDLVENISVNRDVGRNPLFDVVFTLDNTVEAMLNVSAPRMAGLELKPYHYENKISKFDLTLHAFEGTEILSFSFEYCIRLFKRKTVERFITYFNRIISAVLSGPGKPTAEIEIISPREKEQVLVDFNSTKTPYPADKTIDELFVEQVDKGPDRIAAVYEDAQMTYRELNRKAGGLAACLSPRGVNADEAAAIMTDRSLETIIGILAILKAGGAYLPISPDYPETRKNYILKESRAKILLTNCDAAGISDLVDEVVHIDDPGVYTEPGQGSGAHCFHHLAYIIYTSGSTGNPKGTMVIHRNVVRLVKHTNFVDLQEDDRLLQTGALEFDASTFEIWGALLNGLPLYLVGKDNILAADRFKKTLQRYKITTIWLTSPFFNQVLQADIGVFKGLRNLLVGGDVLSPPSINRVREEFPRLNVINGYGPTENTTFSTTFLIDREYPERIPIGKPIANSTAYILNKYGKPQPVGVMGELCVGGDGVSRGYLNNPELTAEKFLTSVSPMAPAAKKIYRTGDVCRWMEDGNIEFFGRIDQQVKIRGFRIELEEIETQLLKFNVIKEVVVLAKQGEHKDNYLCAYITGEDHNRIKVSDLRDHLSGKLPDYMIPSYFVQLDRLPLTTNGKVNRKLLPDPGGSRLGSGATYAAPGNPLEKAIANVWRGVLSLDKVGIDDNFFDIGGTSLKVVELNSKLKEALDRDITVVTLFRYPTVRSLGEYLDREENGELVGIEIDRSQSIVKAKDKRAKRRARKR